MKKIAPAARSGLSATSILSRPAAVAAILALLLGPFANASGIGDAKFQRPRAELLATIPSLYHDLNWSVDFQLECDADYASSCDNSYGASSGYAATNGSVLSGLSEVSIGTGTFDFVGASFSSFAGLDNFQAYSARRPGLRASLGWTARDLGSRLYDSLHKKLLTLPGETLIYPAHGAGSLCGKKLTSDTVSSVGDQRRLNYALQPMSKEDFIRLVTADQPDAPPYFTYDAILNTREHAMLDKTLEQVLCPVDLEEVLRMGDIGARILNVRDPIGYAKGHAAGSINIGLGGQHATWAGTVLDHGNPS